MKQLLKYIVLFNIGGFAYMLIEILFRGRTHWSMGILGGICFILIGLIDTILPIDFSLIGQMFLSSLIVTILEYFSGVFLNLYLNLGVWDYSALPFNFQGQICLIFSIFWFLLSPIAIIVDDIIRWKLFGETKPHYRW